MAEIQPPIFMDGTTSLASQARRMIGGIISQGVARGPIAATTGDLCVTATGTPNMNTNVATGRVYVDGTSSAVQGTYFGENNDSKQLTHSAQHATNNRIDLVVSRFYETLFDAIGVGVKTWAIEVVTGTPSAAPVIPTTPANSFVLAEVLVRSTSNGGGTIIAGNITDRRILSRPWNSAWGIVSWGRNVTNTGALSATTDLAGMSCTFTPVAGRLYKGTLTLPNFVMSSAGQYVTFDVADATGVKVIDLVQRSAQAGDELSAGGSWVEGPSTGLPTGTPLIRKARFVSVTGGTVTLPGSARANSLIVEDVGPA